MRLDLEILGPLQAARNGVRMPIRGKRRASLLAALLASPDHWASRDRLIEAVWGETLPKKPEHALEALVSQLRQSLSDPDDVGASAETSLIVSTNGGYSLQGEAFDTDVSRFRQLVEDGRRAAAGDPAAAADAFAHALGLWRGQPLEGIDLGVDVHPFLTELEDLRRTTQEARLQAELDLGNHDGIVGELHVLVSNDMVSERPWAMLMLALYRSGRQTDALRAYQTAREHLADVGSRPGPELQALEAAILQSDPSLEVPSPSRVNPATAMATSQNLAFPLDSFVGRERELAAVHRCLDTHRLVTIAGTGGIGKTRLANHVGLARTAAHPDGVWIVELAPVSDGAQVVAAIAAALGLHQAERSTRLARVQRFLVDRDALLIIDNCEHLLETCASVIHALLSAAPGLKILATSRESLGVASEHVQRLAPLDRSEELLRDRAGAVRPGFDDVDGAEDLIAVICDRLSGIPLAIELAAMQIRSLSLFELAKRVDGSDNFGRAKSGRTHHQTLDAAIAWSVESLADDTRTVFRRMSMFAGGCDSAAIAVVCLAAPAPLATRCIDELVDKSLIETRPGPEGTLRFWLLEPIRKFAAAEAESAGESLDAAEAHAHYYLDLSFELGPAFGGFGQQGALLRLAAEEYNIARARATLHARSRHDDELDLCWNLFVGWRAGLAQQLGVESILAALELPEGGDVPMRDPFKVARAWYECAHLALDVSMAASVDHAQNGIDIARSLGDDNLLGRLLICQACAIQNTTDRTDGVDVFEEGERLLAQSAGTSWWDERWERAWFDMIRAAFGPRHDLDQNRLLTIRSAEAFEVLGDRVHHVLALMVSAFWGMGTEHQGFVEGALERGIESARRNHLGALIGHVALYQAFIALSDAHDERAKALLSEARFHLGDLPPEVATMIDPTVSIGATQLESEHPSLAATATGSASAIAAAHGEAATRLRQWANNETERPVED